MACGSQSFGASSTPTKTMTFDSCGDSRISTRVTECDGRLKFDFRVVDEDGCGGSLKSVSVKFQDARCADKLDVEGDDLEDAGCAKEDAFDADFHFSRCGDDNRTEGSFEVCNEDRDLTLEDVKGCDLGVSLERCGEKGDETRDMVSEMPSCSDAEYEEEEIVEDELDSSVVEDELDTSDAEDELDSSDTEEEDELDSSDTETAEEDEDEITAEDIPLVLVEDTLIEDEEDDAPSIEAMLLELDAA